MKIRAHHLLCMKYFKGKGYSEEFVSNFRRVLKKFESNPFVEVINSADIICKACPHLEYGKCMKKPDSEEKVEKKDNDIINILGLKLNQKILVKDARKLVDIKLPELRKTCKECEWRRDCI